MLFLFEKKKLSSISEDYEVSNLLLLTCTPCSNIRTNDLHVLKLLKNVQSEPKLNSYC